MTPTSDAWDVPAGAVDDTVAPELDELDRRIVAALQIHARATWQQIARAAGAAQSTVARRAQRLIRSGAIRVVAMPDPLQSRMGYPVLVQIGCDVGTSADVARSLARRTDTRFIALLTGSHDLVAEFIVTSREHLKSILTGELIHVAGIARTNTHHVLRTFKTSYDWSRELLGDVAAALNPQPLDPDRSPRALDVVDLQLAHLLGEDGRRSFADLAAQLDVSESMVRRRVDALQKDGCLVLATMIDPELLDYRCEVFVWLSVDLGRLEEAAAALAALPQVRYLSATTGSTNLACEVILRRQEDLYGFSTEVLGALPGLRDADVTLELQTIKRGYAPAPSPVGSDAGSGVR